MPQFPATIFVAVGLIMFIPVFIWFFCRIEPRADQIAVLIKKTGKNLPDGAIIAPDSKHKGIQADVLAEGRYFENPYIWSWKIAKITDIPAGKLGVKTRLYGKALPAGEIIAGEGEKGIVREPLRPGKYRINPYAYYVEQFDAQSIRPGHVGVVTSLIGKDVLSDGDLPDDMRNAFLVGDGMKGVEAAVLDPGTYYLNPYEVAVVEVNLQSQRFEMSGKDALGFFTQDGFTVTVEGTIEFAVMRDHAALLTHRVGDMEDIMKKAVLPRARGFSRIEGSKHPAINFIVGETRQKFQSDLATHLAGLSKEWGVEIKSVLIRKIIVPDEIAKISRQRELAVQETKKYDQQITQAKSQAELTKQEMLAVQNKEKVEADTARIRAVISAEQGQAVKIVSAEKDLSVAQVRLDAAKHQAEATILAAKGQQDAITAKNVAEASVIKNQVEAFEGGINYARYLFYQKVGPQIETILTTDEKDGLGAVFSPFLPGKEVAK
jgi:regulator of protease activity HflC (stomatin/prohibitin superfamily)